MRWPWQKSNKRASANYTDAVVAALLTQVQGTASATAGATAALEACASLYAACFSAATVKGPARSESLLKPALLAHFARHLIRAGESVHVFEVVDGKPLMLPAATWDIRGGWNPDTWQYRVDIFGPSGSTTRHVPAAQVLHLKYAIDPARPWMGLGPMQWASATGTLAGGLESTLAAESKAPSAQLVPVPLNPGAEDDDTDPLKTLQSQIANAKGKALLVETTAAGWGEGMGSAPQKDWSQIRIGPDWPKVLQDTRADVSMAVAKACNVPPALLDARAQGTAQREALRRFAHLGVEPLARIIEPDLAAALGGEVVLDFGALMASDLAGKARAIKGLVEAGLPLTEATAVAGLMGYRD